MQKLSFERKSTRKVKYPGSYELYIEETIPLKQFLFVIEVAKIQNKIRLKI